MRKNRIAKKPLIVLSSLLGGASVVSLTGLAVKETQRYNHQVAQFSNISQAQIAERFPNYGLTDRAMFPYNPANLNNYHAGSIERGQSITPYGWLGVYDSTNDDDHKKSKMALTAWNGEILWTTDVVDNKTYESIIDIEYDFQTNLVAVLSSNKLETGVFDLNRNNNSTAATKIQFYSALTGKRVPWEIPVNGDFANRAISEMTITSNEGSLLDPKSFTSDTFNSRDNWRAKNLYGIEFVGANSSAGTNLSYRHALINLQPDMTRFYHQTSGKAPTLKQILYKFKNLVKVHILDQQVGSGNIKTKEVNMDLAAIMKANKRGNFNSWVDVRSGSETIEYIQNGKQDYVNLNNAFLLTNPFWSATAEADRNTFFLHILFGSGDQSRTFHLSMKFDRKGNYIGSNAERLDQSELKLNVDAKWFENFNKLSRQAVFDYPANNRPNHNIFTPDLVTISYPYARSNQSLTVDTGGLATSYNVPIYNVAQLKFNSDTGLIVLNKVNSKLDSKVFPIGQEILKNLNQNAYPSSLKDMIHKYNRLLSVSPFDQSFTYAASPNFTSGINASEQSKSFASFWFVKSTSTYANAYNAFPFIIERSQTDPLTTTIEKIIQEGFTFDYRIDPSETNLYFNAAKTAVATHGSPIGNTNKIMLLKQFKTAQISNFGGGITKLDHHTKQIEANNYGALIHSRIKLENWFNRNPFTFTNPSTMWPNNMLLVEANDNSVTIDNNWKLRVPSGQTADDDFYKRAFAAVSHNSNTETTNRLAFKNPRIFVNDGGTGDRIDIRSELAPVSAQLNYYATWFPTVFPTVAKAVEKLTYGYNTTVVKPAIQVMDKFGQQLKISSFFSNINSTAVQGSINTTIQGNLDTNFNIRKSGLTTELQRTPFGKIHNAPTLTVGKNNVDVLRPLFRIVKPSASKGKVLPSWLSNLMKSNPQLWEPAPLAKNAIGGERSFEDILKQYVKLVLNNIQSYEHIQLNEMPISLATLQVVGVLALNPQAASDQKIYQFANGYQAINTKSTNQDQIYIYKDYVTSNNQLDGLVYDQSANKYQQMNQFGFGSSVVNKIKSNWITVPSNSQKPIIEASTGNLLWPILNPGASFGNKGLIFGARYIDGKRDAIAIKALKEAKSNWLFDTLTTLNFKYGLWIQFEYLEGKTWKPLGSKLSDEQMVSNYDSGTGEFKILTDVTDVKRIRIRLVPQTNEEFNKDENAFIKWNPQPSTSEIKFLSAEHIVSANPIKINPKWFSSNALASSKTLDEVDFQDFANYENAIKDEFRKLNPQQTDDLWSKIEIVYRFNDQDYNSEDAIAAAIRNATKDLNRMDQGWFYLWTGSEKDTLGKQMLQARFRIKNTFANEYMFADSNGQIIGDPEQLQTPVKSTIKAKFDLKPYFDDLLINPLVSVINSSVIERIEIPLGKSGIFSGKDFKTITSLLRRVGIKLQFKSWDTTNSDWNAVWFDDLDQIKSYNPTDPKFKIRAILVDSKIYTTSSAYYDNRIMDDNFDGIEINLQIPKLVKAPANFADEIKQLVKSDTPFGGNSKILTINNIHEFNNKLIQSIKKTSMSGTSDYGDLDKFLNVNYQIANSGWKSANELKLWSQAQIVDLSNNKIEVQFSLSKMNPTHPEYVLDQSINTPFIILENGNDVVPLYVHGTEWEKSIKLVKAAGSRQNLNFDWSQASSLDVLKTQSIKGVNLEWKFAGINGKEDNWKQYKAHGFPNNLTSEYPDFVNAQSIELRIKQDDSIKEYYYGPEKDGGGKNWHTGTIDLSNLNYLVSVNSAWFNEEKLSPDAIDINSIGDNVVNNWKQRLISRISAPDELKKQIDIEFNIVWPNANVVGLSQWVDGKQLIQELKKAQVDWNNPNHFGVISLYSSVSNSEQASNQTKIVAKFTTKINSKISFTDINNQMIDDEMELQSWVQTNGITSTIDLSHYINRLESMLTNVVSSDPENGKIDELNVIANDNGKWLFSGRSFDSIDAFLSKFGFEILFSSDIKTSDGVSRTWISKSNLTHYDPTQTKLLVAFTNNSQNLKIKLSSKQIVEPNHDSQDNPITIKLNVPKLIDLQDNWFDDFKKDHGFGGNTKELVINQTKIDNLIVNLKKELGKINSELAQAPLEIVFGFSSTSLSDVTTLKTQLANQLIDQNSNVLKMQVRLSSGTSNDQWILKGYTTNYPQNVFEYNDSPIQIYLHDDGISNALLKPHVSGDSNSLHWRFDNLEVNEQTGLISTPDKQGALVVEYNSQSSAENDSNWTRVQPTKVNTKTNSIWIRLNWTNENQNKFVLGNPLSRTNQFLVNGMIKKSILVDLKDIKWNLSLQTDWLKQIVATGDLISLELDETYVKNKLNETLPIGISNNVEIQYSINDKQWLNAADFRNMLKNNGGKSSYGFILRREDINVRFGLVNGVSADEYGWMIDGHTVNSEINYQSHYQKLINDAIGQNNVVKGVINLELVPQFNAKNFFIKGSTNNPRLEIQEANVLTSQFGPYESDQIFRISLTTSKKGNDWDWKNELKIFENGQFVNELSGLTISSIKQAAIRFQVWDPSNDVAKSKYKLANGAEDKVLDISNNIKVVTEIDNPFTKAGKTLAIQIRDEKNQAIWHQGSGQFRIVVGNSDNLPDGTFQLASDFLNGSNLPNDQKEKLEFVYQVFASEPSNEQIKQAQDKNNINDVNSDWQVFKPNGSGWSTNLRLEVGNYIMVALRVKPEFATGEQAYVLNKDDHSVLIPIKSLDTKLARSAERKPGRVAGLLVDPNRANIDVKSIKLSPMDRNYTSKLLDGWTFLDELMLNNPDNQAAGIDLKIELFTDFHRSSSDEILVSASKSKLVKRQQQAEGMFEGAPYLDSTNQPIIDKNNETVKMWTDPTTGHLAAPKEQDKATRSAMLVKNSIGQYQLQVTEDKKAEWSLFKNQKVLITYQAKQGEGTEALPDFVLTNPYQQDLKEIISKQIKFTLENPQNVVYDWANRDAFSDENIEFESADTNELKPTNGASKVKTVLKLKRYSKTNADTETEISDTTGPRAIAKIEKQIQKDFGDQLQFSYQHIRKDGAINTYGQSANFYSLTSLRNGDTVKLSLKAADPDLVFLDAPQDLIFTVSGLVVEAPTRTALQHLRVEQGGRINGQGTFRVLVHNPADPYQEPDKILKGWKFLVRVWNKDKEIKFNWTDDQSKIVGLENGDKVEWKIADESNNPVKDAYYNTVAGKHNLASDGTVQLQFEQVNYNNGPEHKVVVAQGIGDYPAKESENQYPESTGFVIGGLQERLLRFDLTQIAFERIINTLRPHYKGLDGHGVLNFDEKFMDGTWWVNHQGEIYQKEAESSARLASNSEAQPEAIPLEQFFAHTTFYTANPATTPGQLGWQFMSNATAVDHRLWNGNQLWARFDVAQSDTTETERTLSGQFANYNQSAGSTFLLATLPPVSELTTVPDPMSPMWWVLVALGAVLTLGILPIILWRHNKKLKEPKF